MKRAEYIQKQTPQQVAERLKTKTRICKVCFQQMSGDREFATVNNWYETWMKENVADKVSI